MTELDALARRHAAAARDAMDGIMPPPLDGSPSRGVRRRGAAAGAAIVGVGLIGTLVIALSAVTGSDPERPQPGGSVPSTVPTASETLPTESATVATTGVLDRPAIEGEPGWELVGDLPLASQARAFTAPAGESVAVVSRDAAWLVGTDGAWQTVEAPPVDPANCCNGWELVSTTRGPLFLPDGAEPVWLFDLDTLTWERGDPTPEVGTALGSAVVGDELLVVGSAPREGQQITSPAAALDLTSLTWRVVDDVPQPVSVGGVASDGERLFVAGTQQGPLNDISGEHVAFAFESGRWVALPDVPISGQASTVQWMDGVGLLALNYLEESAILDESGAWRTMPVPMDSGECSPAVLAAAGGGVGWCDGLAWFDSSSLQWRVVARDARDGLPVDATFSVVGGTLIAIQTPDESTVRLWSMPLPPPAG